MIQIDRSRFLYIDDARRVGECQYDALADGNRWIIVFTELRNNPGPSVTNSVEYIITQFCQQNGFKLEECRFIERYESHPDDLDEIIIPMGGEPSWRRVAPDEAQGILEALK